MLPVVGGSIVPAGELTDVVAVLGTHGSCTGTLVAPDVVVTAGHCTEIAPVEIVAATTDYAKAGERVDVASVTAYPGWQTGYDVAAIVLAHPVTSATPRAVATSCSLGGFSRDSEVQIAGFGAVDADPGANTALRAALTHVIDPQCMDGHGCRPLIAPDGEFVAGDTAVASCFGDSGGPVYYDTPRGMIAIGAVSRGMSGGATACSGGIYVRLDKLVDWIEQTTGRTIEKDPCTPEPVGGCSTSSGDSLGTLVALLALACPAGFRKSRPSPGQRTH